MGLGAIWCSKDDLYQISADIKNIKIKYKLNHLAEVKWNMISNINYKMYLELINYFFNSNKIFYRGYFVDKKQLNNEIYNQTHEDFYYKCYYGLLQNIFNREYKFNIFIDIEDHHSYTRTRKLLNILNNSNNDYHHEMINKIQPIQSYESQLLQLADILTGAICYNNRTDYNNLTSTAKKEIIELIKRRTQLSLNKKTFPSEKNLICFFGGLFKSDKEWDEYYEEVYSKFKNDFLNENRPLYYNNKIIRIRRMPEVFGKEQTFYHITNYEEQGIENRVPDWRRCERIAWVREFIEQSFCVNSKCNCSGIHNWIQPFKSKKRTYIWSETKRFLVILEERNEYYLLITAFYINEKNGKKVKELNMNYNNKTSEIIKKICN